MFYVSQAAAVCDRSLSAIGVRSTELFVNANIHRIL